jgi:tight adherence protein B
MLRRRVGKVVVLQSRRRAVAGRSTAAPIMRAGGNAVDRALQRWLPGGETLAVGLAGSGQSLARVAGIGVGIAAGLASAAVFFGVPLLAAVLLLAPTALAATHVIVAARARRARMLFARGFPDALAVIIRSLRASLPVTAAIGEAARGAGPVARVFAAIVEDIQLGQPLETALWGAARRIGVADFDFFVVTLTLQRETGGNLAVTLEGLDETLRLRRQLAMKIKAMAAEARASAMIIGSLPFAMGGLLWATSPDYLVVLFVTPLGHALLGAGMASIVVGGLIIGQMMQIRV